MYETFYRYFKCVKNPNIDDVKKIIEHGIDDYNDGLYHACEGGHLELVKFMIDNGANEWSEALDYACKSGNLEIFKLILSKEPTIIDEKTMENACYSGNLKIINILTKEGVDNWAFGLKGACKGGHINIINLMIKNMRYIFNLEDMLNDDEMLDVWNLGLIDASEEGHLELVKLMIKKGANNYSILQRTCNLSIYKLYIKYTKNYSIDNYRAFLINYCLVYYLMTHKNLSKLRPLPMDLIRLLKEFI